MDTNPATVTGSPVTHLPHLLPLNYVPATTADGGRALGVLWESMVELGRRITFNEGFATAGMTCGEADELSRALIAVGYAQAAVVVIADHSTEDSEDEGDEHVLDDAADDTDAAYSFAESYVADLAETMGLPELAANIVYRKHRQPSGR